MTLPAKQAENDEFNSGWGVFESGRVRDPVWLNEFTGREPRYPYRRAQCCWDQVRATVEVPRSRMSGSKVVDLTPAKFQLCRYHAENLLGNDPDARAYWMDEE